MTLTNYYTLLAVSLATLVLLVGPPFVKIVRLIDEGQQQTEAARQRIAARQASQGTASDDEPDPGEKT